MNRKYVLKQGYNSNPNDRLDRDNGISMYLSHILPILTGTYILYNWKLGYKSNPVLGKKWYESNPKYNSLAISVIWVTIVT